MHGLSGSSRVAAILVGSLWGSAALAEDPPVLYETTLPGYNLAHAHDVVVDDTGHAYFIGSAYEDGHSLDVLVGKLSPSGTTQWTRYISGSSHNYATALALGANGDVWVTGWTDSPEFPLVNPMDSTFQVREAFLMRLDADDGAILYSTFLGGDYTDRASGIAIGSGGEIYLAGTTGSTDFPTTADAYQPEPSFPLYFFTDAFVAKLSPSGDEILYSTYFGGTEDDSADHLVLDSSGNIVLAGTSSATDFPLVNPLQSAPNDIFVSMLAADGSTLLFSTFFGGEDDDRLTDLAIDNTDRLVLIGRTQSVSFPTTPGAFQEEFAGEINGCEIPFGGRYNCDDMFVTKLAADGSALDWSTYLGGTRIDEGRSIAVDALGRVYVAGYTVSTDFPGGDASAGAQFLVSRLGPDGGTLDYTHAIPSGSANRGNGVAVDGNGDVYLTGTVGVPASIYVSKFGGQMAADATGVEAGVRPFASLQLGAGAPNPFHPSTRLDYVIPTDAAASAVKVRVYDVAGQMVRELVNATQSAGSHSVTWRGRDDRGRSVSSGVYFVRLEAAGESRTRKVVKLN